MTIDSGVRFRPRVPELLRLEGWYTVSEPKFAPFVPYRLKISCRFNDILRCADFPAGKPKHFESCFGAWGLHRKQPVRYCQDPNFAIAYVPDKHGNFLGRSFVHWMGNSALEIGRVYGNRLSVDDLITLVKMNIIMNSDVVPAQADTYLPDVVR